MTPGHIPINLIRPVLLQAAKVDWGNIPGEDIYAYVSRRCGIHVDTARFYLGRECCESIPFDAADKILCALGAQQYWYSEPLKEVYDSIQLDFYCASPRCGKAFTPKRDKQQYCSANCRSLARYYLGGLKEDRKNRYIPQTERKPGDPRYRPVAA